MIDRNIGSTERIVRFVIGTLLVGGVLASERFGLGQAIALIAAFALFWNSIFARCYLWKWLGLNTCDPSREECHGGSGNTRA